MPVKGAVLKCAPMFMGCYSLMWVDWAVPFSTLIFGVCCMLLWVNWAVPYHTPMIVGSCALLCAQRMVQWLGILVWWPWAISHNLKKNIGKFWTTWHHVKLLMKPYTNMAWAGLLWTEIGEKLEVWWSGYCDMVNTTWGSKVNLSCHVGPKKRFWGDFGHWGLLLCTIYIWYICHVLHFVTEQVIMDLV